MRSNLAHAAPWAPTKPEQQILQKSRKSALGAATSWLPALFTVLTVATFFCAAPLMAQYGQNGAPDGGPVIPTKESFEQSLDEARWSAGGWRFQPWLGLRDASYVTNQVTSSDTGQQGDRDFTATVGAGLRAYYPAGKLFFTAQVLPEYVWWQNSDDKRHLNGRYGAALFGFYNRLHFELSSRLVDQQKFFSREVQQLTSTSELESRLLVEAELARGIATYGYVKVGSIEGNQNDFAIFQSLDRDSEAVGIGLRLASAHGWTARLGYEQGSTDFAPSARDLSNDTSQIEVALGFERGRIDARLELAFENIEPKGLSAIESFNDVTGSFELLYKANQRLSVAAYASREFSYSVANELSYFTSEVQGIRMQTSSKRGGLGIFAAVGQDQYEALGANPNRQDDVKEFGALLDIRVRRLFLVGVNVLRREYDSSDNLFDRDVTSFGLNIQLGELADRLRLGSDRAIW